MSNAIGPLLHALDRLDHFPAPPRCAQPDWSDQSQVRHLQALYTEHHGHHVPAVWAEQMWPLLQTKAAVGARTPTPVLGARTSVRRHGHIPFSRVQWGLMLAGLARLAVLVSGWSAPGHSWLHQENTPSPPLDLVSFPAELPGAPRFSVEWNNPLTDPTLLTP